MPPPTWATPRGRRGSSRPGADGHPLYTLDAALINKPPGTTEIQLQQVRLGFRDAPGISGRARADHGVAQQDTGSVGKVELSGNVQVTGVFPAVRRT